METVFTSLQSAAGGAAIGLAAVLFMALNGRILGATGILAGLMDVADEGWGVRVAFVAGAVAAPALVLALTGSWPALDVPVSRAAVVAGGVIVGFGAALGSGCTSGHGVCGLGRLSPRSAVAVATFMAAAFATVFVARHVVGG